MGEKIRQHSLLEKLVGILFILVANSANTEQAQVQTPSALFAFGDSILDTGNNNNLLSFGKCNFPPYGKDFNGGVPTGRFSNGKVITDFIAAGLKIKETVPAYLDPKLSNEDLPTGVCFASGGSGNDILTARILGAIPLSTQLEKFKEYIGKLKSIVGEQNASSIISNSVYLLSAGNNDIVTYPLTGRLLKYDFLTYTNVLVGWTSDFLKDLYGLGARRVWVLSTLPLGCLPGGRVALGGLCLGFTNLQAQLFNKKLSSGLDSLKRSLTDYKLDFIDVYTILLDIINNPKKSGFDNVVNGCCGTGTIELGPTCIIYNPVICPNTSTHVFWDAGHPTQRTSEVIVSEILRKIPSF